LPLAHFLLPGESVLYEAPDGVYYRRTPFSLYVTGERLLLYAATGRLSSGERAVAEPLAGIESVEYSEVGLLTKKGRLDVRFPAHTLTLTGSPDTIKEVWRALQQHAPTQEGTAQADDEVTIVSPPLPLFDDQPYPPLQVEPLPAAATFTPRPKTFASRRPAVLGIIFCLVALAAAAGMFWRRVHPTTAPTEPRPAESVVATTPQPTPTPTTVTLHVMDEVFTLEAGSHRAVKFALPAGAGGGRLSGGFRVTSGSYVDFYLMRQEQYYRYALGESPDVASIVYREEQWNARVGERLNPGDYYLVFDNRDTATGAQTIAAEFFLVFEQPPPAP
jgi:hypothetical protein